MKKIGAGWFKAKCLAVMDAVARDLALLTADRAIQKSRFVKTIW